MGLEKITKGYFFYCRLCIHKHHCELRHHEFQGISLSDLTKVCTGRILYDSDGNILVCENCEVEIKKPPEKGICGKFEAVLVTSAGALPIPGKNYPAVTQVKA